MIEMLYNIPINPNTMTKHNALHEHGDSQRTHCYPININITPQISKITGVPNAYNCLSRDDIMWVYGGCNGRDTPTDTPWVMRLEKTPIGYVKKWCTFLQVDYMDWVYPGGMLLLDKLWVVYGYRCSCICPTTGKIILMSH